MKNLNFSDQEISIRTRLKKDFDIYAKSILKVRTKKGIVIPLHLNEAQFHLHKKIEEQRQKTGRVRVIILKGRQQGCSTYVQGRFYWRVTHGKGLRAFILTHAIDATTNLFEMVERFHQNCPDFAKPKTGAANSRELYFNKIDSGYKVGTAGTKATGRSQTIQLFHGSEVAFWPHAEEHAAGILQAVPDVEGSEIILESTANGMGNFFHRTWLQAERNDSIFMPIFIPWYWQEEYKIDDEIDIKLTEEEEEYKNTYQLSDAQIVWRRNKIQQLGSVALFRQEYPGSAAEAFAAVADESLISPHLVTAAQIKKVGLEPVGAKIGGCDPARFGDDRTAFIFRQGRIVHKLKFVKGHDVMEVTGLCVNFLKEWQLDKLFIDVVGLGAGIVDRLRELGYGSVIIPVNAASIPSNKDRYLNLRAEMWDKMRQWFADAPVEIPSDQALVTDLTCPQYSFDSNGRLKIESKDEIKKRGLQSPDLADALALTFAYPVADIYHRSLQKNNYLDQEKSFRYET